MFIVNIATPENPDELKLVRDFVNAHPETKVNAAYHQVAHVIDNGSTWLRGGYAFKFWFEDLQTATDFIETVKPFSKAELVNGCL
jgi:hypothetical protein